jgi:ketosteroid isomerase-like protein
MKTLIAALVAVVLSAPAVAQPAADGAVLKADAALVAALAARDAKAASLDDDFAWIDVDGTRYGKEAVTQPPAARGARLNASIESQSLRTDVLLRTYGDLAVVTGRTLSPPAAPGKPAAGAPIQFLHVWVKRPAGWRAILFQDNAVEPAAPAAAPQPAPPNAPACENPCKGMPYTPRSAAESEIIKGYSDLETAVATHDWQRWDPHFADEFIVVGRNGRATTKAERIAQIKQQKDVGALTNPGPLTSARMWVLGDVALMTSEHTTSAVPVTPYRVTRFWVKRDGRWQMAYSQQTGIK